MNSEIDDLLGDLPQQPIKREESIDDLLGDIKALSVPKTRSLNVPTTIGPIIAFKTRLKQELIVGPGTKMWVITDKHGKLHYAEQSKSVVLPDDWKEGDFIPKL